MQFYYSYNKQVHVYILSSNLLHWAPIHMCHIFAYICVWKLFTWYFIDWLAYKPVIILQFFMSTRSTCRWYQGTTGQMSYHWVYSLAHSDNKSHRIILWIIDLFLNSSFHTNYDGKYSIQFFLGNQVSETVSYLSQVTNPGVYDQDSKWIILATEFLL